MFKLKNERVRAHSSHSIYWIAKFRDKLNSTLNLSVADVKRIKLKASVESPIVTLHCLQVQQFRNI